MHAERILSSNLPPPESDTFTRFSSALNGSSRTSNDEVEPEEEKASFLGSRDIGLDAALVLYSSSAGTYQLRRHSRRTRFTLSCSPPTPPQAPRSHRLSLSQGISSPLSSPDASLKLLLGQRSVHRLDNDASDF